MLLDKNNIENILDLKKKRKRKKDYYMVDNILECSIHVLNPHSVTCNRTFCEIDIHYMTFDHDIM